MKTMKLPDFLTYEQIEACVKIFNENSYVASVRKICEEIIEPNIKEINAKLGQENHPKYLAYAIMYVLTEANKVLS